MAEAPKTETLIEQMLEDFSAQKKGEAWNLVKNVDSLRFNLEDHAYMVVREALKDRDTYSNFVPILLEDIVAHHQRLETAFKVLKKVYKRVTGEEYTDKFPEDIIY